MWDGGRSMLDRGDHGGRVSTPGSFSLTKETRELALTIVPSCIRSTSVPKPSSSTPIKFPARTLGSVISPRTLGKPIWLTRYVLFALPLAGTLFFLD